MSPARQGDLDGGYGSDSVRPCRACTDFKSWAKIQASTYKTDAAQTKDPNRKSASVFSSVSSSKKKECPLDKDELGRATWSLLHTMAAYYPESPTQEQQNDMRNFITLFSKFYPCDHCAEDFRRNITKSPPKVESHESLSQWFCEVHNVVSAKLGKLKFDCSKINQRWRDGWLDGSCD